MIRRLTKILATGLVFGPAMPVILYVTLVNLCLAFVANKYAVLFVTKQPAAMDEGLSERFRDFMSFVVLASVCIMFVVLDVTVDGVRNKVDRVTPIAVVLILIWVLYFTCPVSVLPCFRCVFFLPACVRACVRACSQLS
ncbi:hypothetical protein T492DRAFT_432216 [Pavlovales sp. CCMP2436]|nr:hypothetical protein T492DRAFT_432216 [Pavlovales sp. CCMP2436]